jgi:hypothetical protein
MPDDIGLYNKPMAGNVQMWTNEYEPLFDGPIATYDEIGRSVHRIRAGGQRGSRFQWPAMRVGRHEVY